MAPRLGAGGSEVRIPGESRDFSLQIVYRSAMGPNQLPFNGFGGGVKGPGRDLDHPSALVPRL